MEAVESFSSRDQKILDIQKVLLVLNLCEGTQLLVRTCYINLYSKIADQMNALDSPIRWGRTGVTICGTPGIGKSYFCIYLLLRLLKETKYTIVTSILGDTIVFPSNRSAPFSINRDQISLLRSQEKVIFVFDPSVSSSDIPPQPSYFHGFLIFVSSPSSRIKINKDVNLFDFFMDPWSLEEIELEFIKMTNPKKIC